MTVWDEIRCLHVDEAGHDDGVPVVQERPAKHEAPVVPDGDGVDETSFDLHCRHRSINHATSIGIRERDPSHNSQPHALAVGRADMTWNGHRSTYLRRGRRGRAWRRGRWRSRSGRAGAGCTLRRPSSAATGDVMPPPPQIRYDGDREETHGTLSGWNGI